MKTLNQDIQEKNFRKVYLLYGEETYLKSSYKKRLREAVVGEGSVNYQYFEGKGTDVEELKGLAETMPFFADRRLIIVEDSGFFKSSQETMVKFLPEMPDTTCLVFVETDVDKRSKMFKRVKELGYAAEMARQDEARLARWAGEILAGEGKKIKSSTMNRFLDKTGNDMEHIAAELEKLISYTAGRDVITDKDVEDICTEQISNKIFDMVTAIVGGNTAGAMELYEDLLALREPPMRILFLIARQFNQLLLQKELAAAGMDKSAIASRLKIPPFAVGRLTSQARRFTIEQLISCVEVCVESEEAVKRGNLNERIAVELLITKKYQPQDGTGAEHGIKRT